MGKGRKPIPSKIRALRGNPGKRKLNAWEPQPRAEVPTCPDWLVDEAKREWNRVVGELAACGLITGVDRAALAAYCECWAVWREARGLLATGGLTTTNADGGLKKHPAATVANEALSQMHKFLIEFGMTPASRSRISVGGEKKDALEDFLKVHSAKGA